MEIKRKRSPTLDSTECRALSFPRVDSPVPSMATSASTAALSSDVVSVDSGENLRVHLLLVGRGVICGFVSLSHMASDNQYRLLSAFTSWISKMMFFPVRRVSVAVSAMVVQCHLFQRQACLDCQKLFDKSGIVDQVVAVTWRKIDTFSLKSCVKEVNVILIILM